jgi:LmbE family N-acetylglucosaminyl deacetylase
MTQLRRFYAIFLVLLCVSASLRVEVSAQIRPVYDRGAMGLGQILKKLNTSASVLMIGAHPDDEDTALLSYLARGENARTAYLSLTRGDGGQNIIGPELGESLGLIRTEELIQARKLDGAEQFFGRAYDYGFSKTLAEAQQKWDEKVMLCDTVRIIREFQPLVVVSQFSGTPADGHGQHQFAGYISPLAVKAAGDPSQCIQDGLPWKVLKFYQRHRGQGQARLQINTGKYDHLLGRSYFEIAMEARSQHRSQEQGVLELKGDQFSNLNLIGSTATEKSIFEGIDTSIAGYKINGSESHPAEVREAQTAIAKAAAAANSEYDVRSPAKILPHLLAGYLNSTLGVFTKLDHGTLRFFEQKEKEFAKAIKLAAGIQIDALADREIYVPGDTIQASVRVYAVEKGRMKLEKINVGQGNWPVTKVEPPAPQGNQGFFRREVGDFAGYFNIAIPKDAKPTEPYWLSQPRDGDMFRWGAVAWERGLPFVPRALSARVDLDIDGTSVSFFEPLEYRFADDTRGEIRRNVDIVPQATVELDQAMMIVPYSEKPQTRRVVLTVTNHSTKPLAGTAGLNINADRDWPVAASSKTFEIQRSGERQAITFDITIPAKTKAGSYQINAQAMVGDAISSSTMRVIAYPHIQTHRFYRRAATDARVIDLKTTPVKVGYLAGSGDRVPEAIRQMGFGLEMISESELANGNLSRFDVIVVGIRAYQVRPDIVANNKRLLDFANAGGTLIVQYQLPAYAPQNLAPFPHAMGPRTSDENAEVKILVPEHAIFNFPNKIGPADFEGWVQERNLYNFSTMDPKYTGLLETHDANEAENKGGLVIADVGKGKYIYCSYSLFRQLPAGVPGAYRLLANMLSLPKAKK